MTTQPHSIKEEKSIKYYLPHIFGGIILLTLIALTALIIFNNTNKELYFAGREDPTGSEYNPCEEGLKYCPPAVNSSLNFSLLGNRTGCCYDPKKYQCTNPFGGSGVCTCPKNNLVCKNPINPNQSICCAGSARDYFCSFEEQYGKYTIKCKRRTCNLNQIPCTINYKYNGIDVTSSTCCDQEKTKTCGYEEIKIWNETIYKPYCEETEECDSYLKQCENEGFRKCCGEDTKCGIEKETNLPMCVPKTYNDTFLVNPIDIANHLWNSARIKQDLTGVAVTTLEEKNAFILKAHLPLVAAQNPNRISMLLHRNSVSHIH